MDGTYNLSGVFITDIVDITVLNQDGTVKFKISEITDLTIGNSADSADVVGRGSAILKRIKSNKQATVTGTNGVYSIPLLEVSSGGTMQTGINGEGVRTKINIPEDITIKTADQATLGHRAVGTIGNEIIEIRAWKPGTGGKGLLLTQAATTSPTHFTYDPDDKLIEFAAGTIPVDTKITVYYNREIYAAVLENSASSFAGTYPLWINLIVEDECDQEFKARIIMPRGQFDDNYDITAGNTIGTQSFTINSLKPTGNCPGATLSSSDNLWELIIFKKDIEDAPILP